MIDLGKLSADREGLATALEAMRREQVELTMKIARQEGAIWYVEMLMAQAGVDAQAVDGETGGNDAGDQ